MKAVVVNPESTGVAIEEKVLRPLETGEALVEVDTVAFATPTSTLLMVTLVKSQDVFLGTKVSVSLKRLLQM